jgi:O-antigen/teichoic acid export membrane protein
VFSSLKRRLAPKDSFGRGVAFLVGSNAAAQVITVLAYPVLTRLYTPYDFGVLAIFASVTGMVLVFASLRYELAIPLPTTDIVAGGVLAGALLSLLFVVCGLAVLLSLFADQLFWILGAPGLTEHAWLVVAAVLVGSAYEILRYWGIRKARYRVIAMTNMTRSVGQVVLQVGLGVLAWGPLGLLLGHTVGLFLGIGSLLRAQWAGADRGWVVDWRTVVPAMRRYWRFPLLSAPSSLVNSAGFFLPPLLFSAYYGPAVAGWFALAIRLIGLPMGLLGRSVAEVFLAEVARGGLGDGVSLEKLFTTTVRKMFIWGAPPVLAIALAGPTLFSWVLGAEWESVGLYVQLLAPAFVSQIIVSPLAQTLNIVGRQDIHLYWDILRLAAVLLAILGCASGGMSATWSVAAIGVALTVTYGILYVLLRKIVREQPMRERASAEVG